MKRRLLLWLLVFGLVWLVFFRQFYNFQGLHKFKEKFQPRWSPRYLVYPGPASLPAVVLALNRASSGDDFIWQYYQEFIGHRLKTTLSTAGDRLLIHRSGPADIRG